MRSFPRPWARIKRAAVLLAGGCAGLTLAQEPETAARTGVAVLRISGAIGPATSNYVTRGLTQAAADGAPLVVLEIDTPGGLDSAMRDIIQGILAAPMPVIGFVTPQGARAASAGTYILYAAHVAAMAPATNLGAATPVAIGGPTPPPRPSPADSEPAAEQDGGSDPVPAPDGAEDRAPTSRPGTPEPASAMERKSINDAVAYIRSLAEQRGRNADWAERAVREAASLSAQGALESNVIDLIASDLADLLRLLDGYSIDFNGRRMTLETAALVPYQIEPDWRTRLLEVISDPTVAYMLMLLGIYGLIFEGYNPGAIVPGVVGAIALLLALFAFQVLPVNYAGLALILLGIVLMLAEFMVPSFGALGIGGIAAFIFGSVILIDVDIPGYGISLPVIVSMSAAGALAIFGIVWLAMKSRARPVVSGVEEMAGAIGTALGDFAQDGAVWVHGERWQAVTDVPIHAGQRLRVVRIDGLTLHVEPVIGADSAP
jgi:membrane-bound serine protease (ClpP class)